MPEVKEALSIRFAPSQADRLAAAANEAGISKGEFVRRCVSTALALQAAGSPTAITSSPFPGPHVVRIEVDQVPDAADEATKQAVARNSTVLNGECRCGARVTVLDGIPPAPRPSPAAPGDAPSFVPSTSKPPPAQSVLMTVSRPQIARQTVIGRIDHHPSCPASGGHHQ